MAGCASLAHGNGLVGLHDAWVERHGVSPEHAPTNRSRLCDAPGILCAATPWFTRRRWNVKPPGI